MAKPFWQPRLKASCGRRSARNRVVSSPRRPNGFAEAVLSWGLLIEVGLHSVPILVAPGLFDLRNQVLRNAPMYQHQLRPTIRRWLQRNRCHREDALGELAVAPGLNDASPVDQVDGDPDDIALTERGPP